MLGVICGLKSEAKIADRMPNVIVGCTAAQTGRAAELAKFLILRGAKRLISFGLAGGVGPDLLPGDLIFGATVMSQKDAWEADSLWIRKMINIMPGALSVPLWGSDTIVTTTADKQRIYTRTACLATDMESHEIARVAHEAKIPFNVIRAIVDPYDMDLPPAALTPLTDEGRVNLKAVYKSVVNQPSQLIDLLRLGHNSARATSALKRAVAAVKEIENVR